MNEPKAGYKSTEFWMSIIAMVLTGAGIGINPETVDTVVTYLPVVVSSIYTLGRSLVKAFTN